MIELIEQARAGIEALCRKYRVARLEVFGSAVTGRFDPSRSDLDFLVEYLPSGPVAPFLQYIDFLMDLEKLLGCKVDLVERKAIRNPYFLRAVDASRELLYAA